MPRLSRTPPIVLIAPLVMILAGWLYWPTLQLPLIYDTLLHIRIAGGLTLLSVWLPTEAFGFYRPMTFFPLLVIHQLFDGYPAWLLHGTNVLQHAANAGLLAWLSWRLWPDWRRALAVGAIFAAFPFAYQAVAVYGHNVHPAIAGLMLLGLHSYLTAVGQPSSRRWWVLTWLLFGVMMLTHETAVLFGGFLALVHICAQPALLFKGRRLLRQPWRWFLLAGLIYLVIYQLFPISRAPQAEAFGRNLGLNGLYVLQAAVFPLTWFAHLLPAMRGAWITLASGGLVLGTSAWLAFWRPSWRAPLLLAWGWWAASSLLLSITLPTDYLLRGPRLLYLGSVGVALLWGHLFAFIWSHKGETNKGLRALAWATLLLFILGTSGQFIRSKLAEYEQLTQPIMVLRETLQPQENAQEEEIVLVNLPQWLDVPPTTYAIGVEFVTMMGDYLFAEELVKNNLPGLHKTWAVSLPELQSSPPYAYSVQAQHEWPAAITGSKRHFFITSYPAEGPQTNYTGYLLPAQAPPTEAIANFGLYQLTFAGAEACAGKISVQLHWLAATASIPETTSVFVQVLSEDGRLLAQADGPPLGLRPGLLRAPLDSRLIDFRSVDLPANQAASTVVVGVYDFGSGLRSPATDSQGRPLLNSAWQIPIAPCS